MRNPSSRVCGLLALLAALAGCASAGKRYEQGVELEQRGRSLEAARRYLDALKKEPSLADARRRLEETGGRAVDDLLRESAALEAAGRPGEAADALLRLEELRRDAAAVGVQLAAPADYAGRRRATFDRAIDAALAAAGAPSGGEWAERVRALERADARLAPSPDQKARLDRARFGVFLAWSEAEAARGRYREAYDVAERGLRGAPAGLAEAARLADFRAEVLRRGTVRVAVLPLVTDDETRGRLSEELFPELDDRLAERHWRAAPPLVEVTDPVRTAREARREGLSRRAATEREAARLGRALGAELVVVAEVDSIRVGEAQVRDTRRPVRTRDGVDTAYVVREGRREAWARVSLVLVDVRQARVVDRATATASGSARFRRGVFAGEPRVLNLSRDDRDLFAPGLEERAGRDLAMELAGELAERVAREVFDAALRRVP